jgi:hypothetical protein
MNPLDADVTPPKTTDQVMASTKPTIAESALKVTIGQRLARAAGPMPNIKGDRPPELESDRPAS